MWDKNSIRVIFLYHMTLTEVMQGSSAERSTSLQDPEWLHTRYIGKDDKEAELSWDCPLSAYFQPLQHGSFGVVRLFAWKLQAPKTNVSMSKVGAADSL